ncbi:hypothetical protein SAMN02745244_00393 [Tessaracoccus bendigoensis DSM 12906]|uniref:Uncharacterized protein n=1 Tax=Tessaracoccus bendigoensis DSM 12906 TaxID=1123357 RepID=A0A1M6BA18_9ACTN|nr:hypothetical protein SAMN02745244_00393 [Tessaracoccus bendigoensis DSM 12906]
MTPPRAMFQLRCTAVVHYTFGGMWDNRFSPARAFRGGSAGLGPFILWGEENRSGSLLPEPPSAPADP